MDEAYAIDSTTGTSFCQDTIAKEMQNVHAAFEVLKDDIAQPPDQKYMHWVTTLIVPGVQISRFQDFWVGQICFRPPDQPPFFPDRFRCRSKLEKKGGCPDTPPFCLVWNNVHLEQSETKKYHVEACGCR